jgi:hypothetical protein
LNFLRRFSFSSSARSFIAPRGRCLRRERVCASQCCLMRRCAQGAAWRAARAAHTPARLMGLLSPPYLPRPRIGELGGYFQMGGLQVILVCCHCCLLAAPRRPPSPGGNFQRTLSQMARWATQRPAAAIQHVLRLATAPARPVPRRIPGCCCVRRSPTLLLRPTQLSEAA